VGRVPSASGGVPADLLAGTPPRSGGGFWATYLDVAGSVRLFRYSIVHRRRPDSQLGQMCGIVSFEGKRSTPQGLRRLWPGPTRRIVRHPGPTRSLGGSTATCARPEHSRRCINCRPKLPVLGVLTTSEIGANRGTQTQFAFPEFTDAVMSTSQRIDPTGDD